MHLRAFSIPTGGRVLFALVFCNSYPLGTVCFGYRRSAFRIEGVHQPTIWVRVPWNTDISPQVVLLQPMIKVARYLKDLISDISP